MLPSSRQRNEKGRYLKSRLVGLWHFAGAELHGWEAATTALSHRLPLDFAMTSASADGFRAGWLGRGRPKIAAQGNAILVLDGTLFDTDELGADGADDAELLLRLFLKTDPVAALPQIDGDFALAYFDGRRLLLARDRLGLKPLYYAQSRPHFAFASRPRALLSLDWVDHEPNPRFVALFAGSHYRTIDQDPSASPYRDVRQLKAGSWLEVDAEGMREGAYWQLNEQSELDEADPNLAERYRELLLDAVQRRLSRSGNPAFTLSGGMDSSSVLSCAVKIGGRKQHAFSTVYEDPTYDESNEIRSMLADMVEQWHPVRIGTPDVFGLIGELVEIHDEPVATATWLSHFVLARQVAASGFTHLFGGLGGDELNAGEYEYFIYHFADLHRAGRAEQLEREVAGWMHHHDHPIFRKSPDLVAEGFRSLVDFEQPGRCLPDRARIERYYRAISPDLLDLRNYDPPMDGPFSSYLKNRCFHDIFRETAPCCLRAEDRHAAATGLERFDPFFDYRLVEFMFRVSGTRKYSKGVTKALLREAMRDILPEETRTRTIKTGWNAPAHLWFVGDGADRLRDSVTSRHFRERNIYVVPEVLRLIDEHEQIVRCGAARENHMMFLWQLANMCAWLDLIESGALTDTATR